jgi:hypothetical protein
MPGSTPPAKRQRKLQLFPARSNRLCREIA